MAKPPKVQQTHAREAAAEWVDISTLVPWDKNPRHNDGKPVEAVAESLRRFGWGAPIVARRESGEIIAGHTRLKAAQKLGMKEVPVRYVDLDENEAHLLALADNRVGELAEWDDGVLTEILSGYAPEDRIAAGWDEAQFNAMLKTLDAERSRDSTEGDRDDDAAPDELPEEPVTRLGDVWILGNHRLLCGDSTDAALVVSAHGHHAAEMAFTDPPYGVDYVGKTADALTIQNDGASGLAELLRGAFSVMLDVVAPGGAWYVCGPQGANGCAFMSSMLDVGVLRQTLIWVKDAFVLGRSDFHYRHEPVYYGWSPGAPHRFRGNRTLDSILEFPRPRENKLHPTMKPVPLAEFAISKSSDLGDAVFDPFCGSGTTIIACEKTGRRAAAVELDPRYCDVIVARWEKFTGKVAVRG